MISATSLSTEYMRVNSWHKRLNPSVNRTYSNFETRALLGGLKMVMEGPGTKRNGIPNIRAVEELAAIRKEALPDSVRVVMNRA